MSIVHPDKSNSVYAAPIAKLVTHAHKTLTDPIKRAYYLCHGRPSREETYDNQEASDMVARMSYIISAYERNQEEQNKQRLQQSQEMTQELEVMKKSPADKLSASSNLLPNLGAPNLSNPNRNDLPSLGAQDPSGIQSDEVF